MRLATFGRRVELSGIESAGSNRERADSYSGESITSYVGGWVEGQRVAANLLSLATGQASLCKGDANGPFFPCRHGGERQVDFASRTGARPPATKGLYGVCIKVPITRTSRNLYRDNNALLVDREARQTFIPEPAHVDRSGGRGLVGKDGYVSHRQDPTRGGCVAARSGLLAYRLRTLARLDGIGLGRQWTSHNQARDYCESE